MTATKQSRFTHSGNLLLAGFAAMILMMGVLVYLSLRQDISLVSKDYYEQELGYQQKIDATFNALSFPISVHTDAQVVRLQLPPELSRALTNGKVYFYCPSDESKDRTEVINANEGGLYLFNKQQLQGSGYLIKLSFNAQGKSFYKELPL